MSDDDDLIVPSEHLEAEGITIKNPQRQVLEEQGKFPRRVWMSERRHGYVKKELREYRRRKIAERDTQIAAKQTEASHA